MWRFAELPVSFCASCVMVFGCVLASCCTRRSRLYSPSYGYYRAVNKPMMSVILTIASLGTRVALAYLLSATPLGVTGIWLSVPIGWALADAIGIGYYLKTKTA